MKATELMIGDWVQRAASVTGNEGKVLGVGMGVIILQAGHGYYPIDYERVKPIPLTPEILEKNGWRHHATYGSAEDETLEEIYMLYQHSFEVVFDNKEAVSIRHFVSEEDDGYDKLLIEYRDNGYKPMYVHTLQHTLRLYGLNELADNFKV